MTEDDLKQIEIRKRLAVVPNVHDTIGEASARHVIERDTPALIAEVRRLRKEAIARGAMTCDQCGTVLTVENRHISGLMCIPCGLPVMDAH